MNPTDATTLDRPLRLLSYLATAITIPLNIATTVLSLQSQFRPWGRSRHVSAFCFAFIPLAISFVATSASLKYMKNNGKAPQGLHYRLLDFAAAVTYFGILIPVWAIEVGGMYRPGFGLLIGYTTAPMIVDMFIHAYFTISHVAWGKMFSVFGFSRSSSCQQCPNCQAEFVPGAAKTKTKKGYSLLRGEDYLDVEADPIQYRDSEDFLGEGSERAERSEQGPAAENSGKAQNVAQV